MKGRFPQREQNSSVLISATAIRSAPTSDIRFAPVSPYFGYVFTDPVGTGWYRGTGECIVEGDFNYVFKHQKRYAAGITLMGRYNLLSKHESWRPYVQAGFGMVGTNLSMRDFGVGFQLFLQCRCRHPVFLEPLQCSKF